jgi:hypothetical protein
LLCGWRYLKYCFHRASECKFNRDASNKSQR